VESALLVIDVQQSFTQRPYFSEVGLSTYLMAQNALINEAQNRGVPIVRVYHTSPTSRDSTSSLVKQQDAFALDSGWVRPLDGLTDFDAEHTIYKTRHSALVGTGLDVWLTERGIRRLIVSGIRTEQCCETTTRHASDLGWAVVFAADATMTWDMQTPSGATLSADAIRERTAAALHKRFAAVTSAADVWLA
jgi:nicotinamidase-related amidase